MNILFVCSGNTCRSPMAEGYVNSLKLKDITASSAGFGFSGDEVSENSVLVMSEMGVDISAHRSRTLNTYLIDAADKIICMTHSHKNALVSFGVNEEKIEVLANGIDDPFGCDISVYRTCARSIVSAIDKLLGIQKIEVVLAGEQDAENIEQIEKECFSEPWSLNSIKEAIANKTLFFVAKASGETAGYVGLSIYADEGYITNIAVKEKYRAKGVATALLGRICQACIEKELAFFSLEVRKSNEKAIKLYKRFGMKQEGERKNFYDLPKEHALIFTRRF